MAEQIKIDLGCKVTPSGFELCTSDEAWMEFEATVEVEYIHGSWIISNIKAESMHDNSTAYLDSQFFLKVISFIIKTDLWDFIQTTAEERRCAA